MSSEIRLTQSPDAHVPENRQQELRETQLRLIKAMGLFKENYTVCFGRKLSLLEEPRWNESHKALSFNRTIYAGTAWEDAGIMENGTVFSWKLGVWPFGPMFTPFGMCVLTLYCLQTFYTKGISLITMNGHILQYALPVGFINSVLNTRFNWKYAPLWDLYVASHEKNG